MDLYRKEYQKVLEELKVDSRYQQNLKEVKIAGAGLLIITLWSIFNAIFRGYGQTAETLTFTMGFPTWFFYSTVITFIAAFIFQIWLALAVIKE